MKTKQNICVCCGKRLWWWQRRVCSGISDGHRIWCQTCSDLKCPPKSELRKWIDSAATISAMAAVLVLVVLVVLVLVVLAIEYLDKAGLI